MPPQLGPATKAELLNVEEAVGQGEEQDREEAGLEGGGDAPALALRAASGYAFSHSPYPIIDN